MYVHKKIHKCYNATISQNNESAFHIHNTDYTGSKVLKSGATAKNVWLITFNHKSPKNVEYLPKN